MPKPILPCLTGSRFVAAFLVVLFHFGWLHPFPWLLFQYGRAAVSFFFILSGIVLTHVYYQPVITGKIHWAGFFNLRLSRIIPLHVATWMVATVLHLYFGWWHYHENNPVLSWITGLLCVQVWFPTLDNLFRWNAQAWSISCELFFYALFPFILPLLARYLKSRTSIIVGAVGAYLLQLLLCFSTTCILEKLIEPGHSFLGYTSPGYATSEILLVFPPLRLGEFVVGMCIGLLLLDARPVVKSRVLANCLLGVCIVALILFMRLPWAATVTDTRTYLLVVPILGVLATVLVSGKTVITALLNHPLAILLGEASYALYLVHLFFLPPDNPTLLQYALCLVGTIVASLIFYFFLERPARDIWRRCFARSRTGATNMSTKLAV